MKPLKSWMTWFIVLTSASTAIGASFFISWTAGQDPSSASHLQVHLVEYMMYGVILGLALILIAKQFRVMQMLQFESDRASYIVRSYLKDPIAKDRQLIGQGQPSKHTKNALNQIAMNIPNADVDTPRGLRRFYFERHIVSVGAITDAGHEPNQNVLVEILHERLSADNKTVELFASVLITLGLIGTILGLMLMMNSLTGVMKQNGSGDGLLEALASDSGPLAGLGVAFMTTLMGSILGGVVLRVLTGIVERTISEFVALVAELTEVHVIGVLKNDPKATAR